MFITGSCCEEEEAGVDSASIGYHDVVVVVSLVQIQDLPRYEAGSEVGNTNMAAVFGPCQEVRRPRSKGHVADGAQLSMWPGRAEARYEGI